MEKVHEQRLKVRLLAVCASPRTGNSYFLLEQALSAIRSPFGDKVEIDLYHLMKKSFAPCEACGACKKTKGECRIKDDFQGLRDRWVRSQAILYSLPVYHMSVPGQLKCFIDRLGSSQGFYYQARNHRETFSIPRLLKSVGVIVQGAHLFGGQEKALDFMIDHIVLMRCVPVPGDLSESYVGVAGWCGGDIRPTAIKTLLEQGDRDAQLTVKAVRELGVRVVEMAYILIEGVKQNRTVLEKEPLYSHKLEEERHSAKGKTV